MDGSAWIRSQLAGFHCAACGSGYRTAGIRVLAQREELFFVALDCADCQSEAVAIVSLEREGIGSSTKRPLVADGDGRSEPLDGPRQRPVQASDILAMHEFLRGFDGDFRRLFRVPREHAAGPGDA